MNCPDCENRLRGDGSCCDYCGWTMVGGGDDPRLPSSRTRDQIAAETNRRTARRAVVLLDQASAVMRAVIAEIGLLPDTKGNQTRHRTASEIETQIRQLESTLRSASFHA